MSELKPCPFCGGKAYHGSASCWNSEKEEWIPNFWHRVICKNCGTQTNAFYTEAEAIEAWNRRAERMAKLYKKQTTDGLYQLYCGECCQMLDCNFYVDYKGIQSYCTNCGAKLDWWSLNEIN